MNFRDAGPCDTAGVTAARWYLEFRQRRVGPPTGKRNCRQLSTTRRSEGSLDGCLRLPCPSLNRGYGVRFSFPIPASAPGKIPDRKIPDRRADPPRVVDASLVLRGRPDRERLEHDEMPEDFPRQATDYGR